MLRSQRGVFFFSSRRRHTRSYGDWSSDVCSSDLGLMAVLFAAATRLEAWLDATEYLQRTGPALDVVLSVSAPASDGAVTRAANDRLRSEERRVGKEGRSGWAVEHGEERGKTMWLE